jgi:ABC-type transport system involved in multi-copper enzyme maturation permease subunit
LVFAPFLILFLIAVTVVSILPDVQTDSQYWIKLGAILIASGVYCLAFTALGMLISTLVHRSSTSVIVSLAAWTFFMFIIPNLGISIARDLAGVPPGERVEMQGRLAAVQAIYERIQKEKSGRNDQIGIDMVNQIWGAQREIFENYRPKLNALMRLTRAIVRTSPAGALTFLMTDIAGTGFLEDSRLKDAVMLHVRLNFNKYIQLEPGQPGVFEYSRSGIGEAFALSALADSLVIVAFAFLCIGLAAARFAVYDPR